jgi:hypothetical protein
LGDGVVVADVTVVVVLGALWLPLWGCPPLSAWASVGTATASALAVTSSAESLRLILLLFLLWVARIPVSATHDSRSAVEAGRVFLLPL